MPLTQSSLMQLELQYTAFRHHTQRHRDCPAAKAAYKRAPHASSPRAQTEAKTVAPKLCAASKADIGRLKLNG